jgi:AraC-like DNA-binding protein
MEYPTINFDNMNVRITIGDYILNVLYVRFGYFYSSMHKHSHSNKSYELHYIPGGYGTLIANEQEYPIIPGTLFMTGPDIEHEQLTLPDDPMAEYCICFEVIEGPARPYPARTHEELENSTIAELIKETLFWFGQDTQNMLLSFQQLSIETTHRYIGYDRMVKQSIEQIIIKLIRNYTSNRPSLRQLPIRTLDDDRLILIEESFLTNYGDITIQELANLLGLSKRQTERTLKDNYSTTFTQKRTIARLNAAAFFLKTTSLSISSIAHKVGYSTLEHFCQSFKKHYGISATVYRNAASYI